MLPFLKANIELQLKSGAELVMIFDTASGELSPHLYTTLVAPIKVDDGAYIAAGSVITDNVEKDALALGRARQVAKPGRAKAVRAERKALKDKSSKGDE